MEMSEVCFKGPQVPQNLNIVLGYILIKKSTTLLERLYRYMLNEKGFENEINLSLPLRDRKVYEKTDDFSSLCSVVMTELKNQKRCL